MRVIIPAGDLKPVVEEVVGAIERVHNIGSIPRFAVVFTDYRAPFARYDPNSGRPIIELSRRGPHPYLSLTHEIGHLLDHTIGNFEVYSSEQEHSPLWNAIETS